MKCVVRNCEADALPATSFSNAGIGQPDRLLVTISGLCRPHCDIVLRQGTGAVDIDVDEIVPDG